MAGDIFDELRRLKAAFPNPEAALVNVLLRRVSQWREDDSSLEILIRDLEQSLSGMAFSNHERRALVSLGLARLRDAIDSVRGMTVNERLVTFGLVERWDHTSEVNRATLRAKVLA